MSHFTVAVFTKFRIPDLSKVLGKYEETSDPDSPYTIFANDPEYDLDPVARMPGYWYNPNAKWDYFQIGGGWHGYFHKKDGTPFDEGPANELDISHGFEAWAYVDTDGVWHEPGKVGWWGTNDSTDQSRVEYSEKFQKYLEEAICENLYLTIVDCHI